MTLPTSTRVTDPYETDGVQRDFEFDFPAFYNADTGHYGIEVRRLTELEYEVIDKSLYDIFLNDEDKSGYIRFHVAPMAGDDIYIAGDTTRSQQLNLINYGRYSAQSIEKAFDLIVALIQEFVSKVDEETRQRILSDQSLRDFLLIKFNQFTAEVTTKIDKHIGDINGFMSSLIPMFVCIMRKEIAYYAETQLDSIIDAKLSDLSTQVANAIAENDAALIRLNESILKIEAATTATAIGARLFDTAAAGVHPVTGVPVGSYFNVRSPNAESYVDEYQNVGGVATATGKRYLSSLGVQLQEKPASTIKDASGQSQQEINARTATPYDFGAIGDGLAHPLSERFASLAAAQAVYPTATSLDEYIDGLALQNWWVDVASNRYPYATCHGAFVINTNITNRHINSYTNPFKTKHIDFCAYVECVGVTGNAWERISWRQTMRTGYLEMWDSGGSVFANRTVDVLLYEEDFIHASSSMRHVLKNARRYGMLGASGSANSINGTTANNNTSNLGDYQFGSCGYRFKHGDYNFTSRVDTGGTREVGQRTTLTVSGPLPFTNLTGGFIKFKDKPYLITSNTENTIEVYPWITELDMSGVFQISYGGDFALIGPDSNNIKMSSGSSDCAICAGSEGFYVGTKLQRTNEGNDIGLRLGNGVNSAQIGGTYLGTYFELNVFDIVKTSVNSDNALIIRPIALDESKCFTLAPISTTARTPAPSLSNSWNIDVGNSRIGPKYLQYYDGLNPATSVSASFRNPQFKLRANSATITLTDDAKFRELYGNVDISFEIFGTAPNNSTSGVTTLRCQSGYTINGVADDLIIPASNSAIKVSARLVNEKDWRVYVFYAERPKGSKTHDWASLAAGVQQSTTLTVTGARVGDAAVASMDVALNGTSLRAEVTATNTVTVYHHNPTAAPVDVVSGNLMVKIV